MVKRAGVALNNWYNDKPVCLQNYDYENADWWLFYLVVLSDEMSLSCLLNAINSFI